MNEHIDIKFPSKDGLQSLCEYHKNGGELFDGLEVFCEKNYRTPLIDGVLRSWNIGFVEIDITQLGKYSKSTTIIDINGDIESWPFTMLYVK